MRLWILSIGLFCLGALVLGQNPVRQRQYAADVVVRQANQLSKFHQPVPIAPRMHPPDHPGHVWRWHQNYGWLALPVAAAPAAVVLPEAYVLPAQVPTYTVTEPASFQMICPYCNHPITLQAR